MPDPIVTPPALPQGVQSVLPVHARRGHFMPQVDGWLSVSLPGELVRGIVEEIFTRDVVTVRINSIVARTSEHGVRKGDLVPVERAVGQLDTEIWRPIDRREQQEAEAREAAERAAAASRVAPELEPDVEEAAGSEPAPIPVAAEPAPKRGWWQAGRAK